MTTEEDKTKVKGVDVVSILCGFSDGFIAVLCLLVYFCADCLGTCSLTAY